MELYFKMFPLKNIYNIVMNAESLCVVDISKDYNRPFSSSILSFSQCIWALILPHANYRNLRKVEFQLCHQEVVLRTKKKKKKKPKKR